MKRNLLSKWQEQSRPKNKEAFFGKEHRAEKDNEIADLKRELEIITI